MKRMITFGLCIICCFLFRPQLNSKQRAYTYPFKEKELYNQVRTCKVAVLLFYTVDKYNHREADRSQKELRATFARLSKSGFYPRKAVRFMQVNSADPVVRTFAQDNDIPLDKLPFIVLFRDGVPLEDQHGILKLTGYPSRQDIKRFVDQYVTLDIAAYVQEERALKQYQDVIRDRAHIYYTPYFSRVANPWNDWWGWPYYGMAQGNYGGNVGVNFFASNY